MASIKRSVLYDIQTEQPILPLTVVKWGEIEGDPADQTDLPIPSGSATFNFTYLDGTTGSIRVITL